MTIAWRHALLLPWRPFGASVICFWHSSMLLIKCCMLCIQIVLWWFSKWVLGRPTSFGHWVLLGRGLSWSSFLCSRSPPTSCLNSCAPIFASGPSSVCILYAGLYSYVSLVLQLLGEADGLVQDDVTSKCNGFNSAILPRLQVWKANLTQFDFALGLSEKNVCAFVP